jgi:hypothetical protein
MMNWKGDTIPEFAWRDKGKPRKPSVGINGLWAEI